MCSWSHRFLLYHSQKKEDICKSEGPISGAEANHVDHLYSLYVLPHLSKISFIWGRGHFLATARYLLFSLSCITSLITVNNTHNKYNLHSNISTDLTELDRQAKQTFQLHQIPRTNYWQVYTERQLQAAIMTHCDVIKGLSWAQINLPFTQNWH